MERNAKYMELVTLDVADSMSDAISSSSLVTYMNLKPQRGPVDENVHKFASFGPGSKSFPTNHYSFLATAVLSTISYFWTTSHYLTLHHDAGDR